MVRVFYRSFGLAGRWVFRPIKYVWNFVYRACGFVGTMVILSIAILLAKYDPDANY